MKRNIFAVNFVLLTLIFQLVCSRQHSQWKGKIDEINGVSVVSNPIKPMYGEDVFDADGKFIPKIPFRHHPSHWRNGKLYCLAEDSQGFHIVKRYRVTWRI